MDILRQSLFFHICKGFSIFSLNFSLILTFYSHSNPFPGQLPLREPPRSCPQRKNERRQIPLTPFVVGVISKKLSFSHPSKTLAAVDGTIRLRLERNPRLSAARGTHRSEIFPGAAGSGLAGIPAKYLENLELKSVILELADDLHHGVLSSYGTQFPPPVHVSGTLELALGDAKYNTAKYEPKSIS